jgi:hypothetical protein
MLAKTSLCQRNTYSLTNKKKLKEKNIYDLIESSEIIFPFNGKFIN